LDSNNLTKMKKWSGRNEVIETSGRLHHLWPQNKRLHTPRTTDYRHTRQDRWIQTELAFTLAKNATKPNPFGIIPLQTTKKENNWKTEETLERGAVTLETERVKGSSTWRSWWWWWMFCTLRLFDLRERVWTCFVCSLRKIKIFPFLLKKLLKANCFSPCLVAYHLKNAYWGLFLPES